MDKAFYWWAALMFSLAVWGIVSWAVLRLV